MTAALRPIAGDELLAAVSVTIESCCKPHKNETGKITRWYGANTDIDDRRHAEEARVRMRKLEALGTLAGSIAHDFNNILLAIRGNVSLALEEQPETGSLNSYLQEIDKASRRGVDLVRRILSFSKQDEPVQKKISLQQLAEEVRALMRATLPAQLELCLSADASAPPVLADASQIHQVLLNLLTNAAHAIGAHRGTIGLAVERVSVTADANIPGLICGEYVRVAVTDTGCGMTQATLARIFDQFFTTKPPGQGTGLGLSIVDGIMQQHHGVIAVTSEVGRGSRFELYFPAADHDSGDIAETKSSSATLARGEQVLYVDDDSLLVQLVSRKLMRLGYSVQGVTDPIAALDLIRTQPERFDAVVTDLSLPGIPGLELAQEILKIRPSMPIVATSGFVTEADEARGREIGVRGFLLKPQTIDELGDTLARLLDASARPTAGSELEQQISPPECCVPGVDCIPCARLVPAGA
jgi:nitrogen-specific signal transduction histidine kinase/ActR/RegA family two-component response regulator